VKGPGIQYNRSGSRFATTGSLSGPGSEGVGHDLFGHKPRVNAAVIDLRSLLAAG